MPSTCVITVQGSLTVVDGSGTDEGMITGGYVGRLGSGAGIQVKSGASLTLYGGSIHDNTVSSGFGGGVAVEKNGTFEMNSGVISKNVAAGRFINGEGNWGGGSGVYVAGTFTMNGGLIKGNGNGVQATHQVDACWGGGVFVDNGGTFTMNDGRIGYNDMNGGNYVTKGGAAVCLMQWHDAPVEGASLAGVDGFTALTGGAVDEADIAYYQGDTLLGGAPVAIGDYTAKYTYTANGTDYTVEKAFAISVPAHTHVWVFDDIAWAEDASSAVGWKATASYHCTYTGCGETASDDVAVTPDALPAAKCLEDQTVTLTAAVSAGDSLDNDEHSGAKDVTVAAIGSHDFDEGIAANVTVTPATCTAAGSKTVKCSRCDETKETALKALGHDWGAWTVKTPATETEPGVEERGCSRCDATQTREIPAGGEEDHAHQAGCHCRCLERLIAFIKGVIRLIKNVFDPDRIC